MNSLCMASISEAPGDDNPALEPNVANYLTDQSRHLCLERPRSFSPRSMLCAFPIVPSIMATATEAQVICVSAPKRWKPLVVWTVGEIEMRLRALDGAA